MDETDRHKHTNAHPAELTTTEARQAARRPMTLRVLVIGTLLAIFAGLAIGAYYYGSADRSPPMEAAPPRT
jgi:hypothetical protein